MIVKYRITRDDYIKAARLFRKLTPRMILVYLAVTLFCIFIAFLGPDFVREGIIGGLIGGVIASLVIRYLLIPYLTKRNYKKYKAMHDEFSLQMAEDGLRFGSSTGEGLVKWDTIYKWRQNDDYILIYPMPRLYHIIPKTIGDDGFDIQAVVEHLTRSVGKDR